MAGPFGAPNAGRIPASAFNRSNGKIAGPAANAFFVSSSLNAKDIQYLTAEDTAAITWPRELNDTLSFSDTADARIKAYFNESLADTTQVADTAVASRLVTLPETITTSDFTNLNPAVLLLLHGDGGQNGTVFTDSSLYNRTATAVNGVTTSTFVKKFGTASIAFTNSNQSLNFSSSDFAFGLNNFTVEFWYYTGDGANTSINTGGSIFFQFGSPANSDYLALRTYSNYSPFTPSLEYYPGYYSTFVYNYNTRAANNIWHHIAVTRRGTTFSIWLDGVLHASGNATVNLTSSLFYIANSAFNTACPNGFFDDIRVTKGKCLYTSAFTPQGQPFTENFFGRVETSIDEQNTLTDSFRNIYLDAANETTNIIDAEPETALADQPAPVYDEYFYQVPVLLHAEGAHLGTTIINSGASTVTISPYGYVATALDQAKFGQTSFRFPDILATQQQYQYSYMLLTHSSAFNFSNNNFTIEFWFYTSVAGHGSLVNKAPSNNCLFQYGASNTAPRFEIRSVQTFNPMRLGVTNNSDAYVCAPGATLANNTWHHVALTRQSDASNRSILTLWVNGQKYSSGIHTDITYYTEQNVYLGSSLTPNYMNQFVGYIDEFRITKNLARYTSSFTPPTAPFPDLFGYESTFVDGISGFDDPFTGNRPTEVLLENVFIAPQSYLATYDTLSDSFVGVDSAKLDIAWYVFEQIEIAEDPTFARKLVASVFEKLTKSFSSFETYAPTLKYNTLQKEIINTASNVVLGFPLSIIQTLTVADATVIIQSLRVLEQLRISSPALANTINTLTIAERFKLLDGLYKFLFAEASEAFTFDSSLTRKLTTPNTVSEAFNLEDLTGSKLLIRVTADETINLDTINVLKYLFKPTLTDKIITSAAYVAPNNSITTWVVNTGNNFVTEYTNYNFNSFAESEDAYLGATSDGLYSLTGDDDDGADIIAHIKSGLMQINNSRFTAFKAAYLGLRGGGNWVLKLVTGDGKEYVYSILAQDMQTTKVRIGKGLRSRYFAFELLSTGQDFDLDNIEFVPILAGRRV